ncbi:unnamed protein product, partial [Meganyctiphanes norvegica]
MALHEAACEALFLRELFSELIQLPEQTPRIWSDNMGAIGLAHHQKYHKRSKHIANKFHATRWYIQKGYITVKYVPSRDNLADLFTKPLIGRKLNNPTNSMIRGKATSTQINNRYR